MPTGSWFYVDQGQQRGPVATEELAGWIQSARLPRNVQVWREGMPQWTAAETLSEITSQLQVVGFFVMGPNGPQGPVDLQVMLEWARAGHIGRETLSGARVFPIGSRRVPSRDRALHPGDGSRLRPPRRRGRPRHLRSRPGHMRPARRCRPHAKRAPPIVTVPVRCAATQEDGEQARKLYDVWVCRRGGNGQMNRVTSRRSSTS